MSRFQLILSAALPTVVALLGAGYVALAYYRASAVVERRAAADEQLRQIGERGGGWAAALAELEAQALPPLTDACATELPRGEPASLMVWVAPFAGRVANSAALHAGSDLVGWSTFGLARLSLDRPLRDELFSRTVLETLASPSQWERLIWRRDGQNVPFVDRLCWLAVVQVREVRPEVQLSVAVHDIASGALLCRGRLEVDPRPRPVSGGRGAAELPPQFVSFTMHEPAAVDRAIRFSALHRLCRAGGATLCAQVGPRL